MLYSAKAGLADFIQPSLGPLQPNLPNNDFMDTIEHFGIKIWVFVTVTFINVHPPLSDLLSGKLPTVPEEHGNDAIYNKSLGWDYTDLMTASTMEVCL